MPESESHSARLPVIRRVAIFANPIAGRGRGQAIAKGIQSKLEAAGMIAIPILQPPDLAPADSLEKADALIVIGGDGTVRAAVRRCLGVRKDVPPVLLVPMGTANLMAKHLGIDWPTEKLAERVVRALSKGNIHYMDAGRADGEVFLLMAGIGIDATVVRELDRQRRGPIGYASYILPGLWAAAHYRHTALEVTIDGKIAFESAPAVAFVGNVSEYGTGFSILPKARPDDGLLDVCVVPAASRAELIEQFLRAAAGEHLESPGVVYAQGKEILIDAARPLPVQVDGDPAGYTPVRIDLLPTRLAFIVPN